MTEAQATKMIAQLSQMNDWLSYVYFMVEATAWSTGFSAGFLMAICFIRALIVRRIIT